MRKCGLLSVLAILGFLFAFSGVVYADLNDGLVAYYPFNGNANDESGNGNNGLVRGAVLTEDRFGNVNSAYDFDGIDDYIRISNNPDFELPNLGTISVWFKLTFKGDGADPNNVIINKYRSDTPGEDGYSLAVNQLMSDETGSWIQSEDNALVGWIKDNDRNVSAGPIQTVTTILFEEWIHCAYVIKDQQVYFYINGKLIEYEGNAINPSLGNSLDLLIGSGMNKYSWIYNFFCGSIDDVRIYNRVLSECEILELYGAFCAPTYTSSGFESPLADGPVKVKKNRVLPVKAELIDENGLLMTDTEIIKAPIIQVTYTSSTGGEAIPVSDYAYVGMGSDGNAFEYNPTDEVWQFNLKTNNYTGPGTYTIMMKSGDETEYLVDTCEAQFVVE